MLLTILGFLFGAVLSFRFDVLILLPSILLGWLCAIVGGLAIGNTGVSILFVMIFVATALQIGYIFGIGLQWASRWSSQSPSRRDWPEKATAAPDRAF